MKSGTIVALAVAVMIVMASSLGAVLIMNSGNNKTLTDSSTDDSSSDVSTVNNDPCTVVLDGNTGASLSGDGTYTVGSKVTVTADCEDDTLFVAWLDDDGDVVSNNSKYTFKATAGTTTLFASCMTYPTLNETYQFYSEDDWTSATWTIYEVGGNNTNEIGVSNNGSYVFEDEGLYKVDIDAIDAQENEIQMTTQISTMSCAFSYAWASGDHEYQVEISIPLSRYCLAVNSDTERGLADDYSNALEFITPDEPCIAEIADQIEAQLTGYNITDDETIANIVLDLVQGSITYAYDNKLYGQEEYWAYPVETLYSLKGDCEDTTFLYSSIMKAMGYDTVVCYAYFIEGGHAFSMIELENCDGTAYKLSSGNTNYTKNFYYCETTLDEIPNDYDVGCEITGNLRESYCFLTNDTNSTPTAYSITVSHSYSPPSWPFWPFR